MVSTTEAGNVGERLPLPLRKHDGEDISNQRTLSPAIKQKKETKGDGI